MCVHKRGPDGLLARHAGAMLLRVGNDVTTLQRTTPMRGDDWVSDHCRSTIRPESSCGRRYRRDRDVFAAQCPSLVTHDQVLDYRSGVGTTLVAEVLGGDLMNSSRNHEKQHSTR